MTSRKTTTRTSKTASRRRTGVRAGGFGIGTRTTVGSTTGKPNLL